MSKQPEKTFAEYHAEKASYGGVSWEFHARAETFIRDQAAEIEALQAQVASLMADNAALVALLTNAERTWTASHNLDDDRHHESMMALRRALETQPHPGAPLMERHREEVDKAWNAALEEGARILETVFDQPTMADEIRKRRLSKQG